MKRCRTELREGDDHKMHRYCTVHRSWMVNDRYCYWARDLMLVRPITEVVEELPPKRKN